MELHLRLGQWVLAHGGKHLLLIGFATLSPKSRAIQNLAATRAMEAVLTGRLCTRGLDLRL